MFALLIFTQERKIKSSESPWYFSCAFREPISWEVQCNLSLCSLTCWDNLHVSLRSQWFGRLTFLSPINTKCYQNPLQIAICYCKEQGRNSTFGFLFAAVTQWQKTVAIALCKNFISENIWGRVSPWDLCELVLIYSNRGLSFILTSNWFYVFHSSLKKNVNSGMILILPSTDL